MSDGTQETKLLECPFCGGEARLYDYDTATDTWIVICGSCPAVMASRKSPEEAAAWWNRRATPSPVGASVPKRVEAVIVSGLRRERVNAEMSDFSPGHLARELADIDAALAWISQFSRVPQE